MGNIFNDDFRDFSITDANFLKVGIRNRKAFSTEIKRTNNNAN